MFKIGQRVVFRKKGALYGDDKVASFLSVGHTREAVSDMAADFYANLADAKVVDGSEGVVRVVYITGYVSVAFDHMDLSRRTGERFTLDIPVHWLEAVD